MENILESILIVNKRFPITSQRLEAGGQRTLAESTARRYLKSAKNQFLITHSQCTRIVVGMVLA